MLLLKINIGDKGKGALSIKSGLFVQKSGLI